MKITINTDSKCIDIHGNVKLGDLITYLEKILPDWRDWNIMHIDYIVPWLDPIIIPYIPQKLTPWWEYQTTDQSIITYDASDINIIGSYNVELKTDSGNTT